MLLPFESVVRRGVILLWRRYSELDDPSLEGQSKAKFLIVLSASPHDELMQKIASSARATRRVKRILGVA